MKIILVSHPLPIQKEHDLVNALFEKGLDYFHLRKPDYSKSDLESFIQQIKPSFYRKISIHTHYALMGKYNLSGIHLPEKIRKDPATRDLIKMAKSRNLKVSTSLHSITDIKEAKLFDYAFLSPVFDSISKPDHASAIDLSEFKKIKSSEPFKTKMIALGGIEINNVEKLADAGFDGIALLGTIWQDFELNNDVHSGIEKFLEIKKRLSELSKV